ncbi:MAG: hypothetical protein AAF337_05155 [Pseudomonadota bacterium]
MAPSAQAIQFYGSPPAGFKVVQLETYRGLPRLGVMDTQGVYPAHSRKKPDLRAPGAQQAAEQIMAGIARHNASFSLIAQLNFWRLNRDCRTGVSAYEAQIEKCGGQLLNHSARITPWRDYIQTLSYALKPEQRSEAFCFGRKDCVVTAIDQVAKQSANGRYARLDEFEKRDFFQSLQSQYFSAFDAYIDSATMPSEVYYVMTAPLGDYDFNNSRFNVRVPFVNGRIGNMGMINAYNLPVKQLKKAPANGRSLPGITLHFQPQKPFEKALEKEVSGVGFNIALPMPAAQARTLVQGQSTRRTIYAVVKIGLEPWTDERVRYRPLSARTAVGYTHSDNKIEFFTDEALTQKIGEAPLVDVPVAAASTAQSKTYQPQPGTKMFDTRALHLLRYGAGDILARDMETIAYGVPGRERQIFSTLQQRIDQANRPVPVSSSAAGQTKLEQNAQRARDAAKHNVFAWTERATWTASQRTAFFDYLMGYTGPPEKNESAWPKELPAIEWGMNIATIFPKGHFTIDRASSGLLADAPTRKTLQAFIKDVAAQYPLTHLTGVYDMGEARFDQKTGKLTFERQPFTHVRSATFAASGSQLYKNRGQALVHPDAKRKALYRFIGSNQDGVGDLKADAVTTKCRSSYVRKSLDCGTGWANFMQGQYYNSYLALDREIAVPALSFTPKKGLELVQRRRGWKLVVEYENPSIKLVPFRYQGRNDKAPVQSETHTIFASVKRVVVISPDGEIVWSKDASQLRSAASLTQVVATQNPGQNTGTAAQSTAYQFPNPVPLGGDRTVDGAIFDFLLAKYQPSRLNDRMVDAMLSSRWQYEQSVSSPLGGRFFNASARKPLPEDLGTLRSSFKAWLMAGAQSFPTQIAMDVSLFYSANTVTPMAQCRQLEADPNAPKRGGNTDLIVARQKSQQCKTAYQNKKRSYDQCEGYRSDVDNARKALDAAEAKGCGEASNSASGKASGQCINPNVDLSLISQEMQRCMTKMCGAQPKSLGSFESYKACLQNAQVVLGEEVQQIMAGATSGQAAASGNACAPARATLTQAQQRYQLSRCDMITQAPAEPDCDFESKIPKPTHMPVTAISIKNSKNCSGAGRYFLRSDRQAATLLPGGQPYADTSLGLDIALSKPLLIPYDTPIPGASLQRPVQAAIVLDIAPSQSGNKASSTVQVNAEPSQPRYTLQP